MGTEASTPVQAMPQDFRDIKQLSPVLTNMIAQWKGDVDKRIEENRILRRANANVVGLREKGELAPDETYIGVRAIDTTIAQKQPDKIAFLAQSRRLAIHTPEDPQSVMRMDYRESEFTRVLKYDGWEADYLKWIDAADLHGWAWMRTQYDISMPGMVRNRFISTENLFFDRRVKDIQDSPIILERHPLTRVIFDALVAENPQMAPQVVASIQGQLGAQKQAYEGSADNVVLYEVFFKQDGTVYRGFYSQMNGAEWAVEPTPFYNGVARETTTLEQIPGAMEASPVTKWENEFERDYPYTCLRDRITEDETLSEVEGQAQQQYYKQDAASSLFSSFVNACKRASRVMWAPKNPNNESGGSAPKQLSMEVRDGAIWEGPMEAFHTPWPDPQVMNAMEALEKQRSLENQQIAWAVTNRQDSRKTATETMAAGQQNSQLSGVNTLMFSIALTFLFRSNWRIIQSQALQGNIRFCVISTGKNDEELLRVKCTIRAAGDVDFVQRQELIQRMQQDWDIFAATPLAQEFLRMYVQVRYPTYSERFLAVLEQAGGDKKLIQSLSLLLKEAVTDEHGQLRPEWTQHAQQLSQIQQMVQQSLNPQGTNANTSGTAQGAAKPGANATANKGIDPATGTPSMAATRANAGIVGGVSGAAQ